MTIVVAGLGRCGSSLVMQMLNAGGVACVGAYPAFEEHEPERWQHWDGKAVKILDPHRQRLPLRCVVIWLDRNPVEQAKSQVKLLTACGVAVPTKATALMCQRLRQDRQQALSVIGERPRPLLTVRFESLLSNPITETQRIADFISVPLDRSAAVSQVVARPPTCAPDMAMELGLIERTEAVAPP